MIDHSTNFLDIDQDSRPIVIQKQCWSCFRLFVAKVSTEVRCPRCLKKREDDFNAPYKYVETSKGEKVPIAKLDHVPAIPDEPKQIRVVTEDKFYSFDLININAMPISTVRLNWMSLRAMAPRVIQIGEARVDFARCRLTRKGKVVGTTNNEWRLLALLCAEPGCIVPRFIMMTQTGYTHNGRTIDTLKAVLNKKLDHRIKMLTGIGYYLEVDHE